MWFDFLPGALEEVDAYSLVPADEARSFVRDRVGKYPVSWIVEFMFGCVGEAELGWSI